MIIFNLQCDAGHQFEGWFGDNQDYENQKSRGLLGCPVCDSHQVEKRLAGVPLLKSSAAKKSAAVKKAAAQNKEASHQANKKPSRRRKPSDVDPVVLLKTIEHHVKKHFRDVGHDFYDQAIKMKNGDIPRANIYGKVTKAQREDLDDNQIEYMMLPNLGPEYDN